MPSRRMRILAEELNKLIAKIDLEEKIAENDDKYPLSPSLDDWLEAAIDAYETRRRREKVFSVRNFFGEPSWDILLDLFIGELKNIKMPTTSVCIGAQVPQTTALRWIALLEKENLVRRYRDTDDSRRVYVQLTDPALKNMVQIFYDRCCVFMTSKPASDPRAKQTGSGCINHEMAREAVLNDAIAQIRVPSEQQPNKVSRQ